MTHFKTAFLFALLLPLISATLVALGAEISLMINSIVKNDLIEVHPILLFPFMLGMAYYNLFGPSFFIGALISPLKFQNIKLNLLFFAMIVMSLSALFCFFISPIGHGYDGFNFSLLLISSTILGYFIHNKRTKKTIDLG